MLNFKTSKGLPREIKCSCGLWAIKTIEQNKVYYCFKCDKFIDDEFRNPIYTVYNGDTTSTGGAYYG